MNPLEIEAERKLSSFYKQYNEIYNGMSFHISIQPDELKKWLDKITNPSSAYHLASYIDDASIIFSTPVEGYNDSYLKDANSLLALIEEVICDTKLAPSTLSSFASLKTKVQGLISDITCLTESVLLKGKNILNDYEATQLNLLTEKRSSVEFYDYKQLTALNGENRVFGAKATEKCRGFDINQFRKADDLSAKPTFFTAPTVDPVIGGLVATIALGLTLLKFPKALWSASSNLSKRESKSNHTPLQP